MTWFDQLLQVDWLNVSGWGVAIGLVFFILRKFTSPTKPWLTWQQAELLRAADVRRGDEYKAAAEKKEELVKAQADTILAQANSLGVVDDFLKKVPVRTPSSGGNLSLEGGS